jgi:hypothetical protein
MAPVQRLPMSSIARWNREQTVDTEDGFEVVAMVLRSYGEQRLTQSAY